MIRLILMPTYQRQDHKIKEYVLFLIFLISNIGFLWGQVTTAPITLTEKRQVIDSLATNMEKHYVFADIGTKVSMLLRDNLKKGLYDNINDAILFADQLTKDIASLNGDKHLRVYYNPQKIKQEFEAGNNDKDAQKIIERQQKIANYGFKEARILPGNIGYLKLDSFTATDEAYKVAIGVMAFLTNCDALIIDLRENGGGDPRLVQLLLSYFYSENDDIHFNDFYVRETDDYRQYWTIPNCPGTRKPDMDLYVLTSNSTFSCAEEFAYDIKNLKRGIIVGSVTGGGAHPVNFYNINGNFAASIPFGRAVNPISKTNWEKTGVEPDIKTQSQNAFNEAYKQALEKLLTKEKDERLKFSYQWAIDGLSAESQPITLTEKQMKPYTGVYGVRTITMENGELYYQLEGRDKLKMIPLQDDYFWFKEIGYFRLKVIFKDGKGIKLEGHYDDGRIDYNDRTK